MKKMNIRKSILAGLVSLMAFAGEAQSYDHHFLLAGASFAVPELEPRLPFPKTGGSSWCARPSMPNR